MWETNNLYVVKPTHRFKKQYKKLRMSGQFDMSKIDTAINILSRGENLPQDYYPHTLGGELAGLWGCHIDNDWVMVYQRDCGTLVLTLYSTGDHQTGYSLH